MSVRHSIERSEQRHVARVEIDLSQSGSWVSKPYEPRRDGIYSFSLENRRPDFEARPPAIFSGALNVEATTDSGRLLSHETFDSHSLYLTNAPQIHWVALNYFELKPPMPAALTIRVRVSKPDPAFSGTASAVILAPPSRIDLGWAGLFGTAEAILWGLPGVILLVAGFIAHRIGDRRPRAGHTID